MTRLEVCEQGPSQQGLLSTGKPIALVQGAKQGAVLRYAALQPSLPKMAKSAEVGRLSAHLRFR